MKDYLKKYWYIGILSIIFVVGIISVIVSSRQGIVSGKKVDGKDIVYSVDGNNVTADELYETLEAQYKVPLSALIFEREVLERTYEYTEDQKVEAQLEADQTIAYYKSQYGEDKALEIIDQQLQAMGYPKGAGLVDYYLNYSAAVKLENDYFKEHQLDEFVEKEQPLLVSHILVQESQDDDLSQEDKDKLAQEKMAEIDELLKTTDFPTVASQHSDDPGSAQRGGDLGIVYKSIQFHPEFLEGTYQIKAGEVSDWVKSPSGYHKIHVVSDNLDQIMSHPGFAQLREALYPNIKGLALFKQAENLNFDFSANPEFEQQLKNFYKVGE